MTDLISKNSQYLVALDNIKEQVIASRQKASLSVNKELINVYHYIGSTIHINQQNNDWGSKVVQTLASDLKATFPDMKGLSRSNLMSMRSFAIAWPDFSGNSIVQQAVGQLPWGHNIALLNKIKSREERIWYANKTIENGWSRNVLVIQIENKLIERQGNAITNFEATMPAPSSELAHDTFKSPYIFDFLKLGEESLERDIEDALTEQIKKFLLELGTGFSFVGKQVKLDVGGDDFYIDLLFFHITLNRYIVIELKAGDFKPEHAGQLNFYLTAVDEQVKLDRHEPSIGLLLCKNRNKLVAEYALRTAANPIGIAEYQINDKLPKEIEEQLPAIEKLIDNVSSVIAEEE
jgi:predicted nuclease of restriction endonuclease-like (RecB) superfamily